jgi:hypothetical protein
MDSTQWKRDPESGSLINVNSDLINKAKEAKALRRAKRQEFEDLKNEAEKHLEEEIDDNNNTDDVLGDILN